MQALDSGITLSIVSLLLLRLAGISVHYHRFSSMPSMVRDNGEHTDTCKCTGQQLMSLHTCPHLPPLSPSHPPRLPSQSCPTHKGKQIHHTQPALHTCRQRFLWVWSFQISTHIPEHNTTCIPETGLMSLWLAHIHPHYTCTTYCMYHA